MQLRWAPRDGWRAFAGEVGVIVLGVLIALVAGEIAQDIGWRAQVAEAREALRPEGDDIASGFQERIATRKCMLAQLDRISAAVLGAGATMTPLPLIVDGPLKGVLRHPSRPWRDGVWQSVVASGVAAHFPTVERQVTATRYYRAEQLSRMNEAEVHDVSQLSILALPIPLDPGVKADVLRLIEGERGRVELMALISRQSLERMQSEAKRIGLPLTLTPIGNSGTWRWCRSQGLT